MTFWQFLQRRAKVAGALGDFARDAIADPEFPRGKRVEYLDYMAHLDRQHASNEATMAFLRDFSDWNEGRDPGRRHDENTFARLERRGSLLDRVRSNANPKIVHLEVERRRRRPRDLFPEGGPA